MADDASVIRSPLLTERGFRHGFSTRRGGVSVGPFSSMNLGWNVGDSWEAVEENHRRIAEAVGFARGQLRLASQVHGAGVLEVLSIEDGARRERSSEPPLPDGTRRGHDALVAREEGLAVGVRTADCVPILVADPENGAVAAIHAGWRGVVAGVIPAALDVLRPASAGRAGLVAAIGPHIRTPRFEVGADVAEQIARVSDASVVVQTDGWPKPHVDLARAVRVQLAAAGLVAEHVDDVGGCTLEESDRFHSHRRDGQRSGRMLSVVVARGRA